MVRQWAEQCDGCDSGPLHYADVRFFNDSSTQGDEAEEAEAAAAAATCNRLYHALTSRSVRAALEAEVLLRTLQLEYRHRPAEWQRRLGPCPR